MSLQQKMYQHEATPPSFIWGSIADALDVMETETVQDKLYNNEVTAPANIWPNISFYLNNLQTFEELRNYEITPPQHTWQAIEGVLDQDIVWQKKMYDVEVTAPDAVKKSVFDNIDGIKKGKVISIAPFRKIAAAAALLVTAGLGYYFYNTQRNNTNAVANNNATKQEVILPKLLDTLHDNIVTENNPTEIAANKTSNKLAIINTVQQKQQLLPKRTTIVKNNTVDNIIKRTRTRAQDLAILVEGEPTLYVKPGTSITPDITYVGSEGDHVIVTGPSGASFSLSKLLVNKLYLSFNAGNRDEMELLDQRIAEAAVWKAKYEKWKKNFEENFFKSGTMGGFIEEAVQATKE